jgi:hypothetical protein
MSRSILQRMKNILDKYCGENQNTHFKFNTFFSKIVPFRDEVEKYRRSGQTIDKNIAHAYCMVGT